MVRFYGLLAAFALCEVAMADIKEYWFNITYVEDVNPTGQFSRRAIGVNGTWPPPPISVSTADTLIVHATNGLGDTVASIHHHGMLFQNATFMDGAVGVSQCGIPPGATFDYQVPLAAQEPGTYWWHSHASGQYVDGLRAPLLIHPAGAEVHSYDEELTVMLGDWYEEEHVELMKSFLSVANPTGAEPVPQTALVYFSQNETYVGGFNENANFTFVPGKTYRIRVINSSAFAMFGFWIDGHDMSVIEVDGLDTEALHADYLTLGVAQRYSVLVTARNDTTENFHVHVNFNSDMFDTVPDGLQLNYTANILYDGATSFADETVYEPSNVLFNDTDLVPAVVMPSEEADVSINLTITFDTYDDGTNRGTFNDVVYNPPVVPTVGTVWSMGNDSTVPTIYAPEGNAFVLEYNQTVELILWNTDSNFHPFHLHGHKFQIVKRSFSYADDTEPVVEGQANPIRRDTVQVPAEGYVVVRFRSDNPGVWLFHCHIEWHLESGLAVTFIEAPLLAQEWVALPSMVTDQCATLGIPTTGNAAGHDSLTDLSGLTVGPYPQNNGWHSKGIAALAMCILTALLGIASVIWYEMGGEITEEEHYQEVKAALDAKAARKAQKGGFFGFGKGKTV